MFFKNTRHYIFLYLLRFNAVSMSADASFALIWLGLTATL